MNTPAAVDRADPILRRLLPDNIAVDPAGRLAVAGCDLVDLAEEYGTPLFVYDEEQLRDRCREAVEAFGQGVAYASKAFLCRAMAALAYEEGMHIDVATGGELHVARSAGVPAERLVLHGNNKSTDELRYALDEGVGRIVVDSFDEFDRLDALHSERGSCPAVLVRITPGIEAHTHQYIQTGQDDSKFGFGVRSGDAIRAIERASNAASVELVGLHAHIGSQIFDAEFYHRAVARLAPMIRSSNLREVSIGGGLGVAYTGDEEAPSIAEWGREVAAACREAGITARVTAEPGRSIVAAAGVTLYTVGTIKEIPEVRTYISVDGGMSDNPRPVLYGSGYETFLPRTVGARRERAISLVGKHCESGDVLVREGMLPTDTVVGDIVATPVTGAYGHSMGSNYNKVLRPAVVFVRDGTARLVVRRETYDDLTRLDV